ncbi:MAG: hypothetical protein ACYC63_20130 [Armatimonadota bacterium]
MLGIAKHFRSLMVAGLVVGLLSTGLAQAAECPFNGGFDLTNLGAPIGWKSDGLWMARSEAKAAGKNGMMIRADKSRAGDRLSTEGYIFVTPGETLHLSLRYMSAEGGPAIGFVFCDAFGTRVGEGLVEALPAAGSWKDYQRTVELPADVCPVPYSAVRPFFLVQQNGVAARFDSFVISRRHQAAVAPRLPRMDAEELPNLLVNPTLRLADDGSVAGWSPLRCDGYAQENAMTLPVEGTQSAKLALRGGEAASGWVGEPVVLDGALPYTLKADACACDLTAGQARLVLRVLDPEDPGVVWLQQTVSLNRASGHDYALSLPRLWVESAPLQAQAAVVLEAASEGAVAAGALALQPEPVTLSVRGGVEGKFKRLKDVSLFVTAINNTASKIIPKAYIKVTDSTGKQVAYEEPKLVAIESQNAAFFPSKPKLPGAGTYKIAVRFSGNGKELATAEYDFVVESL